MNGPYVSKLLVLIALIIFVLVAFGVLVSNATALEETAAGLAFLAASFLVP